MVKISNNQLDMVEWVLIYLLIYFSREVLSNELTCVNDTKE